MQKSILAQSQNTKVNIITAGYPDDEYGVCTDVVGFALKGAGYDLMELVNEDIVQNLELYQIDKVDKNIDFRRVKNLIIYFERNMINLTKDTSIIDEWQPGDIVIFKGHFGIISDKRNNKGVPFVIHHYSMLQVNYEEDVLTRLGEILGHFRVS